MFEEIKELIITYLPSATVIISMIALLIKFITAIKDSKNSVGEAMKNISGTIASIKGINGDLRSDYSVMKEEIKKMSEHFEAVKMENEAMMEKIKLDELTITELSKRLLEFEIEKGAEVHD